MQAVLIIGSEIIFLVQKVKQTENERRLFIQGHDYLPLKKNEKFLFLVQAVKLFSVQQNIFICVKVIWTDALNITCRWIDFCGRDLSLQQVAQEDCQLSSCATELEVDYFPGLLLL